MKRTKTIKVFEANGAYYPYRVIDGKYLKNVFGVRVSGFLSLIVLRNDVMRKGYRVEVIK